MLSAPYINIHNHKDSIKNNNIVSICSFFVQNYQGAENKNNGFFTIGLHPWHVNEVDITEALLKIEQTTQLSNCIGIGEIGLDHVSAAPFDKQLAAFEQQILLAKKMNLPVIIHNVKSQAEIVSIVKKHKFNQPLLFHGFNGKIQMAEQLLDLGAYLSFGKALQYPNTGKTLQLIPTDRVFFETDDSEYSIERIYEMASAVTNIPVNSWKEIVYNNFNKVFSNAKLA